MQRMFVFVFLIGVILLGFVGCSGESEPLRKVNETEAERATEFVTSYKMSMVDAVNKGSFNELEPFLITNNSFYHSLRRYVGDLQREQTKKTLILFEVMNVYKGERNNWFVDALEVVELNENGQVKTEERNVRFELIEDKTETFRVVTIKQQSKN